MKLMCKVCSQKIGSSVQYWRIGVFSKRYFSQEDHNGGGHLKKNYIKSESSVKIISKFEPEVLKGRPAPQDSIKGIDRPFGGGVESILIRSILVNWRLGYFFYLILKGLRHKISKKPLDAA
jgi:hypothetical protein